MGKITLVEKTITVSNETAFVLYCYQKAQIKAKFSDESPIDARLGISNEELKKGLINMGKSFVASFTGAHYEHEYVTMPALDINLIMKTEEVLKFYNEDWLNHLEKIKRPGLLKFGNLGAKEVTNIRIDEPHVLIHLLCYRIFAFTLNEGEKLNTDIKKYFRLLKYFSKYLLNDNKHCPLLLSTNHLDNVGIFLGCSHRQWIGTLYAILESRNLKNSHKIALQSAENLLADIEKIIIKQMIGWLASNTTKAKMSNDYYSKTFAGIEGKIVQEAIKKNPQDETLLLKEDTIYKRKNIVLKALTEKKNPYLAEVRLLYGLLEETYDSRQIFAGVQNFIEDTGWMGILDGYVFFEKLNTELQQLITKATQSLFIPEESKIIQSRAGTALITENATNLSEIAHKGIKLERNFKILVNETVLNWVRKEIRSNLQNLEKLQSKKGETFVDTAKCQFDWLKQTSLSEPVKATEAKTKSNLPPPVPPKPVNTSTKGAGAKSSRRKILPGKVRNISLSRKSSKTNVVNQATDLSTDSVLSIDTDILMQEMVTQSWTDCSSENDSLILEVATVEETLAENTDSRELAFAALVQKNYDKLGQILSKTDEFRDSFDQRSVYLKGFPIPLINIQDEDKNTLLHHAVMNNDEKSVEWLLYYGASVFVANKDELIPLEMIMQSQDDNSIFMRLIDQAKEEARPHQRGIEKFPTLRQLSFEISGQLYLKLCEYNDIVKEREAGIMYQSVTKNIAKLCDKDFTQQRHQAQTMAFKALFAAEKTRNYTELLKSLEKIQELSNNQGGKLHPMLDEVFNKGKNLLDTQSLNNASSIEFSEYSSVDQDKYSPSFFSKRPLRTESREMQSVSLNSSYTRAHSQRKMYQ